MTVALILLCAIVGVGALLYTHHRLHPGAPAEPDAPDAQTDEAESEECCGMHITCERDSLLASVSPEVEYYDDEELDRFAGVSPSDYSRDDVEEFRDILLTLRPDDIAGWARSIQLRGIELPPEVREELLMIVAEERAMRTAKNA